MKKINSGINLFKLFSMFMIAQLHILGMGGIIGATAGTAAYYHAFLCRMRRSARSTAMLLQADISCSAKDKAVKNSGTLA